MQKYTEYLRYSFTNKEINEAAKDLARATQQRTSLEQRKKEVDSALKADIEAQNSIVARLSSYITQGYEYRDIDCCVELDVPEPGKKTVFRSDTGEEVKVQAMTDMDRQMRLELQEASEKSEAKTEHEQPGVIVTPPPVLKRLNAAPAESEILQADAAGPSLVSAVEMGATHRKGRAAGPRNPEQERKAQTQAGRSAGEPDTQESPE